MLQKEWGNRLSSGQLEREATVALIEEAGRLADLGKIDKNGVEERIRKQIAFIAGGDLPFEYDASVVNQRLQRIVNQGLGKNRKDVWENYVKLHIDDMWGVSQGALGDQITLDDLQNQVKFYWSLDEEWPKRASQRRNIHRVS